ncbi:hypothetical protein LN042_27970 [Kitasatospora sp. RB6PN24]|uniref:hypothetical protein n=1 Tax=Kitasatospora humi TaxID=2893891 RepID=UPI001E453526|nr:hypothetical protein [Kitasatospora humi]MCC9310862.1 hypothetical protein [Kitasatospora humi]
MTTRLQRITAAQREIAGDALAQLTTALSAIDVVLPSAGLDSPSQFTGQTLIQLGSIRSDDALKLAEAVLAGAEANRH